MTDFSSKVQQRLPGILTYGMTPPKESTEESKLPSLAQTQSQRIAGLPVDAVVLYDIHDEKDRTTDIPRPFPFSSTLNGLDWANSLGDVKPYVHFRCIAKYSAQQLRDDFAERFPPSKSAVVIVGGAAASQQLPVTMDEAYDIRKSAASSLLCGAVAIPERHSSKGNEHTRMLHKQCHGGVSFFITQCVYNLEEAKNLLSDYAFQCKKEDIEMVPILVTLTPCGSLKTLEFLRWLGVKVSKWLENDLIDAAEDPNRCILEESVDALLALLRDLLLFARAKNIPLGCNVESVAIRKAEIEASVRLVFEAEKLLRSSWA